MNESCHLEHVYICTWISHFTCEVRANRGHDCLPSKPPTNRYQWVMSLIWIRHVVHMNESCQVLGRWTKRGYDCLYLKPQTNRHEWVICIRHVVHMKESSPAHECATSHTWMSHVTYMKSHVSHMNQTCSTYEWVKSRTQMRHVTHVDESCHPYEKSCLSYESDM